MRGNAMWDVVKLVMLPVIYALSKAISQQPLHWTTLILCLVLGAVVVWATRSRHSPPLEETTTAWGQQQSRSAHEEFRQAESKLDETTRSCAKISELNRFKNPTRDELPIGETMKMKFDEKFYDTVERLSIKAMIARDMLERMRRDDSY